MFADYSKSILPQSASFSHAGTQISKNKITNVLFQHIF